MRIQKQLFRHDPENGSFGDCHRTSLAVVFDMDAADVPTLYGDEAAGVTQWQQTEDWLNELGVTQIAVLYDGKTDVKDLLRSVSYVNPDVAYLLGGTSKNGTGHTVVCLGAEIVCDPSLDCSGIVGPMKDGWYWITFFGSTKAVSR